MVCLVLVHQTPTLPAALAELSPWLDWDVEPIADVRGRLASQQHRRVIKTHTPLDGIPLDERVTYIVVGRHPLDVAVSLYHHSQNIDRERQAELSGNPAATATVRPVEEWLDEWIDDPSDPSESLDTVAGNVHHVADAWARRDGNVVLLHYDDLRRDLPGQMRALADRLEISVREAEFRVLVDACGFTSMKDRAEVTAPGRLGVLKDPGAFFRGGRTGDGRRTCTPAQIARYESRVDKLALTEVLWWLHHEEGQP